MSDGPGTAPPPDGGRPPRRGPSPGPVPWPRAEAAARRLADAARTAFDLDRFLVLATLVGLAVVAGSALVVAKLLDDVMGADDVAQRDPRITEWLVQHRTDAWTSFLRAVTHLGDPLVVAAVAATVAVGLFALRRRRLAVMVLVSTAGTAVITTVAKLAVDRGRPPPALWLTTASGPAFPSGHAAQSVALWGALVVVVWASVRSPALRLAAAALAGMACLGVGVSRVYLGVHWASDVLCGWAVATMWVTVLVLLGWSLPRLAGLGLAGRARPPT